MFSRITDMIDSIKEMIATVKAFLFMSGVVMCVVGLGLYLIRAIFDIHSETMDSIALFLVMPAGIYISVEIFGYLLKSGFDKLPSKTK